MTSGNLSAIKTPIKVKQIDLYGKPFFSDNSFVDSLNVYKNKSLIKGVNLKDSLVINSDASLIAHSSTFSSTISTYFHISMVSPLLVLVNSTFDCNELIINFNYSYQNEEFVLIKGLESLDYCNYIKNKSDESRYKINFDLSCRVNEIDNLVDLIVENCTVFSKEFTESNEFSESVVFSTSFQFTISNYFTKTSEFSDTFQFTVSDDFSKSNDFTESNKFTDSSLFSSSNQFTYSNIFTKTQDFSISSDFTFSNVFTDSKQFTHSNKFVCSSEFSSSNLFTNSIVFSKTAEFSITSQFSYSEIFTKSEEFSKSNEFTSSNAFITSTFSRSNYFTKSDYFTPSTKFSTQTYLNPYVTYSRSVVSSYSVIRTVIFSYSNSMFVSYILCYNENGMNSYCLTNVYTYRYFPYIIQSLKMTITVTYLPFYVKPRRGLTKEQLIAITCLSAAVFFTILGIIIMASKKSKEFSDDFSISSENNIIIVDRKDDVHVTKSKHVQNIDDDDDRDLNFWI